MPPGMHVVGFKAETISKVEFNSGIRDQRKIVKSVGLGCYVGRLFYDITLVMGGVGFLYANSPDL